MTQQETPKSFSKWLAEHPWLKLIGALIAIVGGAIGILTFVTGATTLPDLLALLSGKFYDRFEESKYEGKYNTSLWHPFGIEGALIEQRDGALVFQPFAVEEDGNSALIPSLKSPIPFNKFIAMESKLKMDGSVRGTGFIKIQVYSVLNENGWWLECQLANQDKISLVYFCNVYEGVTDANGDIKYSYETEHIPVEFDKWYRSRFEINSEKSEVKFYLT